MVSGRRVLLVVAIASLSAAPAQARPVATVLRVPIAHHAFSHWMLVATRSAGGELATIPRYPSKRWSALREQVMQFLISARWIEGEARLRGIRASRQDVARVYRRDRRESFPKPGEFHRFLERSAMTVGDIMYRIRLDTLSNRIRADVLAGVKGPAARQKALDDFVSGFQRRWRARTVCARRYATADCGRIAGR